MLPRLPCDEKPSCVDLPGGFQLLLDQVGDGNDAAATTLFKRYHDAILRVIRWRYLLQGRLLRRLVDEDDFLQVTFKSVFWRITNRKILFRDEAEFRRLLFGILRKQVLKYIRHYITIRKRSLNRDEESLTSKQLDRLAPAVGPAEGRETADPSPEALADLPEVFRDLASALQAGSSIKEIAEQQHISERTAARDVQHLREWLENREAGRAN